MIEKEILKYQSEYPQLSSHATNFIIEIQSYLSYLEEKLEPKETIFCCSDIIESTFGKMKYRTSPNTPFGMTEFSLAIACLGKNHDKKQIVNAMENVRENDIKQWKKENIPQTLFDKQRQLFTEKVAG